VTASRLRPKVVLWWGIGLTLGGLLLAALMPQLGYALSVQQNASAGVDQGLLSAVSIVVGLTAQVVPPLGVALIGAAVVMTYVARLFSVTSQAEGAAPVD